MSNPRARGPANDVSARLRLPRCERAGGSMSAARAGRERSRAAIRFRDASGKWTDLSWGELDRRRLALAAALRALGIGPGERVAFVSHNRVEMLLVELGVLTLGAIAVPIFPDYGGSTLAPCLRDSGAPVAICGTATQ